MKSYLLSGLAARYRTLDLARFTADLPCDWLLWEPGAWKPPAAHTLSFNAVPPKGPIPPRPTGKAAESLALVLDPKPARVTLGRDEACDLVINDGTLSSQHLIFTHDGTGWFAEDAGSRNGATVDGQKLGGQRLRIKDGTKIVAAQVVLTFHSPAGLWARLKT